MKVDEASSDLRQVPDIERVVNGLRYRTLDARCIAQGGSVAGFIWLFQTQKDNYFRVVEITGLLKALAGGVEFILAPLEVEAAIECYQSLERQSVRYEAAFGNKVQDA